MTTAADDKTEKEREARDLTKHKEQHLGERTSGGKVARLEIKSFSELENLAVILGKSDIVPKDMLNKPANIMLALMFGNEIGLTPAQALQNVMVVNGRPCLWGDATMGLVENSNLQEWWKDEFKPTYEGGAVFFTTKRKGREPVTRVFSMQDATAAKLDKKEGPWQQYPKRMLFHRARSWALRDVYPDVLKGIRYYEEERDVIVLEKGADKVYAVPGEKTGEASAHHPSDPSGGHAGHAAPVTTAAAAAEPAPAAATTPLGKEEVFRVSSGATADLDDVDCYVIRDDAETPNKYFHGSKDWHAMAKTAKDTKVYITATWIEKASKKGPVRWLVALSLKS